LLIRFNGHGEPVSKYGERFLMLLIEEKTGEEICPMEQIILDTG
jgi:hypothetical protein